MKGPRPLRQTITLICMTIIALGVAGCSSDSDSPEASPRTTTTTAASDPLPGAWDTGPVPLRKLRTGLRADGYSNAKITALFKQFGWSKAAEFKIVFYRENGAPFLAKKGWDPSKDTEPRDADHGPYTRRPNHRFVTQGVDPPTDRFRERYSYKVEAERLTLHIDSLSEPGVSHADQVVDLMLLRASSVPTYKRVR
jgi:hypothetical protein